MCKQFRKNLGENLKKIRLERKMTQEQVFLESSVSRSHIAMIEAGKRDVSVSSLFKLSRALNVDLKEIFSFDDINKYSFDINEIYK
jgi:transcriptional regulator with XRE-family HTH domain